MDLDELARKAGFDVDRRNGYGIHIPPGDCEPLDGCLAALVNEVLEEAAKKCDARVSAVFAVEPSREEYEAMACADAVRSLKSLSHILYAHTVSRRTMKTVTQYRWRYYDEARRKWFKTGYTLSEEEAASRYPGAEKVPGSEVVREIAETDAERAAVMGNRHNRYQGPGEAQG